MGVATCPRIVGVATSLSWSLVRAYRSEVSGYQISVWMITKIATDGHAFPDKSLSSDVYVLSSSDVDKVEVFVVRNLEAEVETTSTMSKGVRLLNIVLKIDGEQKVKSCRKWRPHCLGSSHLSTRPYRHKIVLHIFKRCKFSIGQWGGCISRGTCRACNGL